VGIASPVDQGKAPTLAEEELLEVLPVVVAEIEAASTDDCADECFGVVNVVKLETRHESPLQM
jgi:hypothetical protein